MRHARDDYNRIQDPAGLIPEDEPVFLIRGQDALAPVVLAFWAAQAEERGARKAIVRAALKQRDRIIEWQRVHGSKTPDMPEGSGRNLADANPKDPNHV